MPTPKQKIKAKTRGIKAWAVINCKGEFCDAYRNKVEAHCVKEECDENWGEKGAKVVSCLITFPAKNERK